MNNDIKIHVLHTGIVIVDEALPFHQPTDSKIAWTGLFRDKSHQIKLPVSVYLIEHPKGLVLIDTGWHTDNRTKQVRNLLHQYPVNKAELIEGQAVHEQLASLGYQPSDIDYVLLSHLHCDHADGLRHVRQAKQILVSEPEWEAASKDHIKYLHHEWKGVDMQTFKLKDSNLGPYNQSFDLFEDGSIQMIWVPGHSRGLCATKIKSLKDDSYVMLASDIGYARKSWEEDLTPGVIDNLEQAKASLNWIKTQISNPECVEVLANHDPEIEPHIITL